MTDNRIKQVCVTIELPGDPITFTPSLTGQQASHVIVVLEEVKLQILDMLDIEATKLHGSDASFKVRHCSNAIVRINRKKDRL